MIRNNIMIHGLNHIRSGYVPSLNIDPASLHFGQDGGSSIISVDVADATQTWDYEIDSEWWISVSGASRVGDDNSVQIICDIYTVGSIRIGHVIFTSDDCANKILTITQEMDV